jgi:AcrR family transcriptional regulator
LNKHQQRTEATKRRLLKAALRIFSRDGFEAARIDDIAVEAGYTRGAFYAHFQSKEDLFFAMLEDESHKHFEALTRVMEKLESKRERLDALRDYYVSRVVDRRWSILILEFKLYALRHPKLRAELAGMHRSIKSKMKWADIGRIWEARSEHTAETREFVRVALQVVLNGLVLERAYDPASISEIQVLSLLRKLFDFIIDTSYCSAAGPRRSRG